VLGSITPLGERSRGTTWAITIGVYVASAVASSSLLGALLGLIGSDVFAAIDVSHRARAVSLAALVAAGLLLDAHLFGMRLPTLKRQVDSGWIGRYRGWVYGGGFGLQLGLGVVTIVNTSTIYLTLVAAFLSASPAGGAIIVGTLGGIRGFSALSTGLVRRPTHLRALHRLIDRWDSPTAKAVMLTQGFVVVALVIVNPG
jgi:hypothetical protein